MVPKRDNANGTTAIGGSGFDYTQKCVVYGGNAPTPIFLLFSTPYAIEQLAILN